MGKRITTIALLVMILLVCACNSFSEQSEDNGKIIDFSLFSDEELLAMRDQLNMELVDRKIAKKAVVHPGEYLVGIDIPEGQYIASGENVVIEIFEDKQAETRKDQIILEGNTSSIVTLIAGELMRVEYNKIDLEVYTGIAFE